MERQGAHRNSDALLGLSFCFYVRQCSCGVNCGEDSQNRLIFRVFRLISAVFEVFRVPLTPSFVGSNPATPAIMDSVEP